MIRKDKGEMVCECNDCGYTEYGGTQDFMQFVQWLKDEGWRMRKNDDEWIHMCPTCAEGT